MRTEAFPQSGQRGGFGGQYIPGNGEVATDLEIARPPIRKCRLQHIFADTHGYGMDSPAAPVNS